MAPSENQPPDRASWAPGVHLSFQRKVILAFAVSLVVSVVAVTAFLYVRLRHAAVEDAISQQEAFAGTLGAALERELESARAEMEFLAQHQAMRTLSYADRVDPALNGLPEHLDGEKRGVFDAFLRGHPNFSVLFVLLPNGDHYISHPFRVQRGLRKFNLADRPYFKDVTRTHHSVISDSFLGADGERAVAIDVPILDNQGALVAHLGGVLHLRDLSRLVAKPRIGPYTAGFVVDRTGALIAHTDPAMLSPLGLSQFSALPLSAPRGPAGTEIPFSKEMRTVLYTDPLEGEEYAGTIVPFRNGWCFGLVRRMAELDRTLFRHTAGTAALVAMLMLLVSGMGVLAAHRIGQRWDEAERGLRRAHEEMETQVRERGADLIASHAALEREIAERKAADEELRAHRERLEELVAARAAEVRTALLRLQDETAERQRAEAALRRRDAHLRSVIGNVPVVLFATDRDGIITVCEGKALEAQALQPGQVVGLSVFDMCLDRPDIHTHIRRALGGERLTATVGIGAIRYEVAYAPLFSDSGEIAGVIGVATDISERFRGEQALRRSEASLAKAQEIARLGSWEWDLRDNEMTWSAELYRILGVEPEHARASYESYLERVHPEHRERVKEQITRAVEQGGPVTLEHRILPAAGGERVVHLRAEVHRDRQGRPARVFATVHDVHESRLAEQELKSIAEKLSMSNSNLLELAYLASHDLQEPVFSIVALSERLQEQLAPSLDTESRANLGLIHRAASRMMTLIQEMLSLVRVTTHVQPFVAVDLGLVVQEVLGDLRGRIESVGGQVEVGSLPTVYADPVQMRQLLQNLIGNALKFHRPEESPLVKVDAIDPAGAEAPAPALCRFVVEDNGIGFDPALAARLFQPFQRLHESGAFEGSGIGLAICKRILERHGGTIEAQSRPGRGARFIVTLPLAPPGSAMRAG
jgi:PAS domain S-box-containing protein